MFMLPTTNLTFLECSGDNLYKGCGAIRNHPQLLTAPAPRSTKETIVSCLSINCFFYRQQHSKKSVQIEGGGKYGGFGHLWPSGDRRSDFRSGFLLWGCGGGGVTSQNRWNGVQKRTRGLCRSHKQKKAKMDLTRQTQNRKL